MVFRESFTTQLVGSWVKPTWLADHDKVYGKEGSWWRIEPDRLDTAIDDAVRLAVFDQLRAGVTYATDGEQRRQTFSGHFYRLGGIDSEQLGEFTNFANDITEFLEMRKKPATAVDVPKAMPKVMFPRVTGPIAWTEPLLANEVGLLRQLAPRTKVAVIGPVTLSYRLVDEYYGDHRALVMALADALNHEIRFLSEAGIDVVQIDEPEIHFRYSQCEAFAVEAIDRVLQGTSAITACHICYGYAKNIAVKHQTPAYPKALQLVARSRVDAVSVEYEQPGHTPELLAQLGDKAVVLGVLSLDPGSKVEAVKHIVDRVTPVLEVMPGERISLAPDCGMWFLERNFASAKLRSMTLAAEVLRHQSRTPRR